MRPLYGLVILIGCLLIAVFVTTSYLMPDVICTNIPPPSKSEIHPGQYDSNILSDICSGVP